MVFNNQWPMSKVVKLVFTWMATSTYWVFWLICNWIKTRFQDEEFKFQFIIFYAKENLFWNFLYWFASNGIYKTLRIHSWTDISISLNPHLRSFLFCEWQLASELKPRNEQKIKVYIVLSSKWDIYITNLPLKSQKLTEKRGWTESKS